MSYLNGYESVDLNLDAKCGKGWTGTKGNCKRITEKSPSKNRRNKRKALIAGAALGTLYLAHKNAQRDKENPTPETEEEKRTREKVEKNAQKVANDPSEELKQKVREAKARAAEAKKVTEEQRNAE